MALGAVSDVAGVLVLGDILRNLHDRSQRVWVLSLHEHHHRLVEAHAAIVHVIAAI